MSMKTYNVKLIFESSDDSAKIIALLEAERLAVNFCSKIHYDKTSKFGSHKNSIVDLHEKCYFPFRKLYPDIPAQIVIKAEQGCLASYRSIKSNKQEITAPISKKNLSIRLDKRLYTFDQLNGKIRLCVINSKRIQASLSLYPKIQSYLDKYPICDPLLFVNNDEIYLAISFRMPIPVIKPQKVLGIDLGINRIAAMSDGKIIKSKSFNARKRSLRYLKRQLKSKNTASAKKHLKKLYRKERNINKNFTHHVVNEILKTDANVIVLEDLTAIKRQPKNKYKTAFNNKLSQVPFFDLRNILTYKAQGLNKLVTVIDPSYTSQIDFRTGEKTGVRKGCRYYAKDGVVLDADINAANNIALRGLSKLKLPVSCFEPCSVLDGQATVNRLNVGNRFF